MVAFGSSQVTIVELAPTKALRVIFSGQLKFKTASWAWTMTSKVQVTSVSQPELKVYSIVVVPMGKRLPLAGPSDWKISEVAISQLVVPCGAFQLTAISIAPGAAVTIRSVWQLISATNSSCSTVTVKLQSWVLSQTSWAW